MPPLPPVPEDDEDLDFYKILMTRWELPRQPSCYVAKTARGREKQLEKDLPWGMIPVEQHAAFREAEAKQYKEHLDRDALEPLPLEAIMRDEPERILSALRLLRQGKEKGPDGPLEAQGQAGDWGTHGPRHWSGAQHYGAYGLKAICVATVAKGWKAYAGDITAAFLNGGPSPENFIFGSLAQGWATCVPTNSFVSRREYPVW